MLNRVLNGVEFNAWVAANKVLVRVHPDPVDNFTEDFNDVRYLLFMYKERKLNIESARKYGGRILVSYADEHLIPWLQRQSYHVYIYPVRIPDDENVRVQVEQEETSFRASEVVILDRDELQRLYLDIVKTNGLALPHIPPRYITEEVGIAAINGADCVADKAAVFDHLPPALFSPELLELYERVKEEYKQEFGRQMYEECSTLEEASFKRFMYPWTKQLPWIVQEWISKRR